MDPFEIPKVFLELHSEKRFDYWGAPFASLTKAQRETIMRTRWSRVLVLDPIEWDMSPEEIASFDSDDMGMRPGLVRFAGDGTGDAYCWYPHWQEQGKEPPVIFWSHDGGDTGLFARSFAECVVRCILRDAAFGADDVRPEHWDEHAAIIGPWLDASQRKLLATLGKNYSRAACEDADSALVMEIGERPLAGEMPPPKYAESLPKETLARLYNLSVAFWRDLVEEEGREEYRSRLDEALSHARRFG